MSAFLYPTVFGGLLNESLSWTAMSPKAIILGQSFSPNSSHVYLSDIPAGDIIATTPDAVTGLTYVDNVPNSTPFTWLQTSSNRSAYHAVLFDDTGNPATSLLIAYYGESNVTGFPAPIVGEDYFLYSVAPPGGWFELFSEETIGPVNTWPPGYPIALGVNEGFSSYAMPVLYFGRRLIAGEQVCLMPDELDSDECCGPTIRGTECG